MGTLELLKIGVELQCKTLNHAKELLYHLHQKGYRWNSGHTLLEFDNWDDHKEDTRYYLSHISYGGSIPGKVLYGNRRYAGDAIQVYTGWVE